MYKCPWLDCNYAIGLITLKKNFKIINIEKVIIKFAAEFQLMKQDIIEKWLISVEYLKGQI